MYKVVWVYLPPFTEKILYIGNMGNWEIDSLTL